MVGLIFKNTISNRLFKGKSIVVIGAGQVGKATLIREVLEGKRFLWEHR